MTPGDDFMAEGQRYLRWLEDESVTVPHPHEGDQPKAGERLEEGWLDSDTIMAEIERVHDEGHDYGAAYGIPISRRPQDMPLPVRRRIIPPKKIKLDLTFDEEYSKRLYAALVDRRRKFGKGDGNLAPLLGALEFELEKKLKGRQ